jgi:hypothetical protein
MNRILYVLACCFTAAFVTNSAFALGIDVPRPKKEKKKEEKKEEPKKEETTAKKEANPNDQYAKTTEEVLKEAEPLVDRALAAYNKDDSKAFFADYAKSMAGIANDQTYQVLYGKYKALLGNYKSRTLVKEKSSFSKDTPGLLTYNAVFEKNDKILIQVNTTPEEGKLKLMQVQFNSADGQPLAAANAPTPAAGGIQEVKLPKSAWDKQEGNFKVGDWVEYSYPAVADMKMRMEVLEVGDHSLVMSTKSIMAGNTTETKIKQIYSEPDPQLQQKEGEKIKWETKEFSDKVDVPGKGNVAATRYETHIDGKLTGKMWVSKEVPCGGMVKGEDPDGKVTMQLTGFGRK